MLIPVVNRIASNIQLGKRQSTPAQSRCAHQQQAAQRREDRLPRCPRDISGVSRAPYFCPACSEIGNVGRQAGNEDYFNPGARGMFATGATNGAHVRSVSGLNTFRRQRNRYENSLLFLIFFPLRQCALQRRPWRRLKALIVPS